MKTLLFIPLFAWSLFAQNPKVYHEIGDDIYNNIENIKNLKNIDRYTSFTHKIDSYIFDVKQMKIFGFSVESGERIDDKLVYLERLRNLSKENDYFFKSVNKSFDEAIKNEDSSLFKNMLDSKMINIKKNKNKILIYYKEHDQEIDSTGTIDKLLKEEKAKKLKRKKRVNTKKQIQEAKIKRIREKDRIQQEKLEVELTKELQLKKLQIRQEQERELFN